MEATSTAQQLDRVPTLDARVVHFELSWPRFLACTLRRPQRLLAFELAWTGLLVAFVTLMWRTPLPGGDALGVFGQLEAEGKLVVTVLVLGGALRRVWAHLVGAWSRHGGLDRIATLRGPMLEVGDGAATRSYDLRRARLDRLGTFVRVRASTARWAPDFVPAVLFDGMPAVERREPRSASATSVVFGTGWKDAVADARELLGAQSPVWDTLPVVALLGVAIAHATHGAAMVAALAFIAASRIVTRGAILLTPLSDAHRGVAVRPLGDGLQFEDDGFVQRSPGMRVWAANVGDDRIAIESFGTARKRSFNEAAFDELVAWVRDHATYVKETQAPHVTPAWTYVRFPVRVAAGIAALVALATFGRDLDTVLGGDAAVVPMALIAVMVVLTVPNLVRTIATSALVRPLALAPHHRRAPRLDVDEVWTMRDLGAGALIALAGPLLAAGPVLLATAHGTSGVTVLVAGAVVLLVAAHPARAVHREATLVVVAAAAATVAGCFLLLSAATHPAMTPAVAGGTAVALLVLVAIARAADGMLVPLAELGSTFVVGAFVVAVVGGAVALHVVDPRGSRGSFGAIAAVTGVRNDASFDGLERIEVTWRGDTPRVDGSAGLFEGDRGAVARQRVLVLLREAAEEPGPRPRVREIVLLTEAYGRTANYGVNFVSHYYSGHQRIVISHHESANLLADLRSPPGTVLDSEQAYSFHVLRHEIEHGMSVDGGEPRWISEAAAELLTQWAGRDREVMDAAAFDTTYRANVYGGGYEDWADLLGLVLESCFMSPSVPGRFDAAAALLRDPDARSQDLLADCLAERGAVDRDGLAELIEDAGTDRGARAALLERLR